MDWIETEDAKQFHARPTRSRSSISAAAAPTLVVEDSHPPSRTRRSSVAKMQTADPIRAPALGPLEEASEEPPKTLEQQPPQPPLPLSSADVALPAPAPALPLPPPPALVASALPMQRTAPKAPQPPPPPPKRNKPEDEAEKAPRVDAPKAPQPPPKRKKPEDEAEKAPRVERGAVPVVSTNLESLEVEKVMTKDAKDKTAKQGSINSLPLGKQKNGQKSSRPALGTLEPTSWSPRQRRESSRRRSGSCGVRRTLSV